MHKGFLKTSSRQKGIHELAKLQIEQDASKAVLVACEREATLI